MACECDGKNNAIWVLLLGRTTSGIDITSEFDSFGLLTMESLFSFVCVCSDLNRCYHEQNIKFLCPIQVGSLITEDRNMD